MIGLPDQEFLALKQSVFSSKRLGQSQSNGCERGKTHKRLGIIFRKMFALVVNDPDGADCLVVGVQKRNEQQFWYRQSIFPKIGVVSLRIVHNNRLQTIENHA